MKRPNVLFVDQSGEMGGAELFLLDIASRWSKTCKVILLEDGEFRKRLEVADVQVEVIPGGSALSPRRDSGPSSLLAAIPGLPLLALRLAYKARGYDLLYANSQKAFMVSALASICCRKRCVWHLHDILTAEHFNSFLLRSAVFMANRFADKVIANSRATADAFVQAGGSIDKVHIVYNGFEVTRFAADDDDGEARRIREELGCVDVPLVGVFSRLASWKGQHIVLAAIAKLPQVHAVFVGAALFGEQAYEQSLRDLVNELGLSSRVHFLGFRQDVPALMRAVDLVVHSSTTPEPFGRVIVEAMLVRKPVIASAAGGVLELIEDGLTGVLVPPGDPAAMAEAIRRLVGSRQLADQLAGRASEVARKKFSLETVLAELSALLIRA